MPPRGLALWVLAVAGVFVCACGGGPSLELRTQGYSPIRHQLISIRKLQQESEEQQRLDDDLFTVATTENVEGSDKLAKKAEELLEAGANPNACCTIFGNYVLHETSHKDNDDVADALIKFGADVDVVNSNDDTPLHTAACNGAAKVTRVLLSNGATTNAVNGFEETPLHSASEAGSAKVVQLLLTAGADPAAENENGDTPLEVVCTKACPKGEELILDLINKEIEKREQGERNKILDSLTVDELNEALLDLASKKPTAGSRNEAWKLLRNGADKDACCTALGGTALHATAIHDNVPVASALIAANADVNVLDRLGDTPLHIVSTYNAVNVTRELLEAGADLTALDDIGETPLHHAAEFGKPEIVRLMLEAGADPKAVNDEGLTPAEIVCQIPCPPDVEQTLKELFLQATTDASDEDGESLDERMLALAESPSDNETEAKARGLLDQGASPDACCSAFGGSALHLTAGSENEVLAVILIEAGADVNFEDELGDTPLHSVAASNAVGIANLLIASGADVNAVDFVGQTPLMRASALGKEAIAEVLLLAGADPTIKNQDGDTAADLICSFPCSATAKKRLQALLPKPKDDSDVTEDDKTPPASEDTDDDESGEPEGPDGGSSSDDLTTTKEKEIKKQESAELIAAMAEKNKTKAAPPPPPSSIDKPKKPNQSPGGFVPLPPTLNQTIKAETQLELDQELLKVSSSKINDTTAADVQNLLDRGADPDACCNEINGVALHQVSDFNNYIVAEALVAAGADVNARDDFNDTPLHLAAASDADSVARVLIRGKADLNAKNDKGETPLHGAAEWGSVATANALVSGGANRSITDDQGRTPRDFICASLCLKDDARQKLEELLS